jgi:hypothetical protein
MVGEIFFSPLGIADPFGGWACRPAAKELRLAAVGFSKLSSAHLRGRKHRIGKEARPIYPLSRS